jgi:hypothetical protein
MIPDFIICNRTTARDLIQIKSLNVVKFSEKNCSSCQHQITVSEASVDLLNSMPKLRCICIECAVKRLENNKKIQLATTPNHLIELEKIRLAKLLSLN